MIENGAKQFTPEILQDFVDHQSLITCTRHLFQDTQHAGQKATEDSVSEFC